MEMAAADEFNYFRRITYDDLMLAYGGQKVGQKWVGGWERNAPATRKVYKRHVKQFRFWLDNIHVPRSLMDMSLLDVNVSMVKGYAQHLQHRQPPLSPATQRARLSALTNFYEWLRVECVAIDANPARGVTRPPLRKDGSRKHVLTDAEIEALLRVKGHPRHVIATYLLLYTGCRSGEIRGLKWADIDGHNGIIHVFGKGSKMRTIPIHPKLAVKLAVWADWQRNTEGEKYPAIRTALDGPQDRAYVLLTRTGRQMAENELWRIVKARAAKAGILVLPERRDGSGRLVANRSQVSPHTARRTLATTLLRTEQVPLNIVSDLLGHADMNVTRDLYAFSSTDQARKALEKFRP